MNDRALTIFEFQKRFRSEKDCESAIIKMRWPNGFVCPKCGHDDGYRLKARRAIQCTACRHQTSITAGTIFHKSKLPLLKWFWMIFLVAHDKGGASALRLSKQLGMYYKTVWHVLHKIRKAMAGRDEKVIQLGGAIEMDEAYFGHYKNKAQFLVMVEAEKKKSSQVVMKKMLGKMPSEPYVRRAIEASVDNQSQQYFTADYAGAHNVTKKMGHRLSKYTSNPISADMYLSAVHLAISLAKRFLLGTYHGAVNRKYLPDYLSEFCYRFNRKDKENTLANSLLKACLSAKPVTYAAILL